MTATAQIIPFPSHAAPLPPAHPAKHSRSKKLMASLPTKPPRLKTNEDWLAAEREVLRLYRESDAFENTPDDHCIAWNMVDEAILKTTPQTLIQIAVKIRRLTSEYGGMIDECPWAPQETALRQVEAFLANALAQEGVA